MVILISGPISGQLGYIHEDVRIHQLLDRIATSGHGDLSHLSVRYRSWDHVVRSSVDLEQLTQRDKRDWMRLLYQLPEARYLDPTLPRPPSPKGWLKSLYKSEHTAWQVSTDDFFLKIDPILHLQIGDNRHDQNIIFQNTRGVRLGGLIDKKVAFSIQILENQQRFLNFQEREITRLNAIPGQGFFKRYRSGVIDGLRGWDFLNTQAYVGLPISKSISLRLGHGRHFIGDGIRSLLLSDYANNYFYLQLNTKVWIFHFQNIFAELSPISSRDQPGNTLLPKKYMAAHYLTLDISDRFSIGLFESVVFSREGGFELQYLNPLIFYRSVEQILDSPDNVLIGLTTKWIPKNNYQLYAQLLIDELRTDQAFSGRGWWGNKVAVQLGFKNFNVLNVPNLDLQIEYNSARPYTYAHRDEDLTVRPLASYSHFNQALAHPLGANFKEILFSLKYRFSFPIDVEATYMSAKIGDEEEDFIGRDILLNYESRPNDFDNFTGQGISNDISMLRFRASWEFFPQYFVDFNMIHRRQKVENSQGPKTDYIGIGLRVNINQQPALL